MNKILWWLIAGSGGGPNRARIIMELYETPNNANQLAEKLNLNYKTIRHHLKVLEENKIVTTEGKKYGEIYFLSDNMVKNYEAFNQIWSELKKKKRE